MRHVMANTDIYSRWELILLHNVCQLLNGSLHWNVSTMAKMIRISINRRISCHWILGNHQRMPFKYSLDLQ